MSTQDIRGMREQILANAHFLLKRKELQTLAIASSNTLVSEPDTLQVIVAGNTPHFRAMVMLGLKPAIEGGIAGSPESALRKLLLAVTETLLLYIPKMGDHMRNIHGGGIFDEDLIADELKEPQRKCLASDEAY